MLARALSQVDVLAKNARRAHALRVASSGTYSPAKAGDCPDQAQCNTTMLPHGSRNRYPVKALLEEMEAAEHGGTGMGIGLSNNAVLEVVADF